MKKPYFILPLIAVGSISTSSCGKKEAHSNVPTENAITEKTGAAIEEVAVEAPSQFETLAAKAGFAKYLPKDTDSFWTLYDGADIAKRLLNSSIGKYVESLAAEQGGSLEKLTSNQDFQQFAEIAGEELFFAVGDDGAEQMNNLEKAFQSSNFYQMRSMVELFAQSLKEEESIIDEEAYLKDWAKDPKTLEVFKNVNTPPMYLGFKVSDKEKRQAYVERLQGFGSMVLDEQLEGKEVLVAAEKDGFKGFAVKGELFAKLAESEGAEKGAEFLGEETLKQYLEAVKQKVIVVLAGEHEDYVVIFVGPGLEHLQFASSAEESVLAHKGMEFAQQFAANDIAGLLYASNEVYQELLQNQSSIQDRVRGVIQGFKGTDAFGDTSVLEALLGDLVQREKDYYVPFKAGRLGMVALFEDGFKVDMFYGGNAPAFDLVSKRQLSKVGEGEDVLFSANWVCNQAQTELGLEYLDAIGSGAYEATKLFCGMAMQTELAEFSMGFGMLVGMFKQDTLALWGALRGDLASGLGAESAVVVDLKGELPAVPMIAEALIKEAQVPRFSYLSTVKDRSKLASSWETVNKTAENLLKQASEMSGVQIPMQRPFKSESNGLASWTFQIPFAHQNCIPNVSVSDALFIVSTSLDFSNELAEAFEKEPTGEPMAEMQFNFAPLRELSTNWLNLVEQYGAEMMGESDYEQFKMAKPRVEGFLKASESLEYFRVETKTEQAELRSTMHLKVK